MKICTICGAKFVAKWAESVLLKATDMIVKDDYMVRSAKLYPFDNKIHEQVLDSGGVFQIVPEMYSDEQKELLENRILTFFPKWNRVSGISKSMLLDHTVSVFGPYFDSTSSLILCYANTISGGLERQLPVMAKKYNIPCINLANSYTYRDKAIIEEDVLGEVERFLNQN